jgi:uncharacterized lipoprotein YmbA
MRRTIVPTLGLLWLCVGCSLIAPQPDRSKFFVLTPVTREGEHPDGRLTLGIGPVLIPSYLMRPQIARRSGDNQLVFSADRLWGEPLEQGFRRVLTEDLSQILGTIEILQYPWSTGMRVEYQIPIAIGRFEADAQGRVSLNARWAIRLPGRADVLLSRESRITETARDTSTGSVVAAMSEAVGALSDEIAAGLHGAAIGRKLR